MDAIQPETITHTAIHILISTKPSLQSGGRASRHARILAGSRNYLHALREARAELSALIILEEARVNGAFD